MMKKMKKLISLALTTAMVAGMACGVAYAEDKLVVYGIYKAGDQTWFIDEGAAAQAAVEALGGEFIYVDAKMSPDRHADSSGRYRILVPHELRTACSERQP